MRVARLIAAIVVTGAIAFTGAAAHADDTKLTVYPSDPYPDDRLDVIVENAASCPQTGTQEVLLDGKTPMMGYGFHYFRPDAFVVSTSRAFVLVAAGPHSVEVICTDLAGKKSSYRADYTVRGSGLVRPALWPAYDAPGELKVSIDNYEDCKSAGNLPTAKIDGAPAAVKEVPPIYLELVVSGLSPGVHMVTLGCGGLEVTYPLVIGFVTAGGSGTGAPGLPSGFDSDETPITFATVPSPSQVGFDPVEIVIALLVGGALILLIGFPAEFVNKTIEANKAEISSWFRRIDAVVRRLRPGSGQLKPWHWFAVYCGLTAVLTTLVDPLAGFSMASLITLLAFLIAVPVTTIVYSGVREAFTRRLTGVPAVLETVPKALLLALIMTVFSRLADFQPGYVYGLVAGYVALRERRLDVARDGRTVIAGWAALLALSLAAWIALDPVHAAAGASDASFLLRLWDGVLTATFLLGVQTLVFGLIPIQFLDGHVLRQWSVKIWAAVYAPGIVLFVFLLGLNRAAAAQRGITAGLVPALILFLAFGVGSMLFWGFFQIRGSAAATAAIPAQATPPEEPVAATTPAAPPPDAPR